MNRLCLFIATLFVGHVILAVAHPGPHGHSHDDGPTQTVALQDGDETFVEIEIRDGYRFIAANGIPNHPTGRFPNRGNPNAIAPQRYLFRVSTEPTVANDQVPAARPNGPPAPPPIFGVALNGVVFDPGTAEYWQNDPQSGWHYQALSENINLGIDQSNAHVQPTGAYHYHGLPLGLIAALGGNDSKMLLLGYAADGFPIYAPNAPEDPNEPNSEFTTLQSSYRLKSGTRPSGPGGRHDGTFDEDFEYVAGLGDLDEFNGREGVTPEYPDGTYYYVLTEDYPYIPRRHRGEPDPSFARQPPRGGGPARGPSPPVRPPRRP